MYLGDHDSLPLRWSGRLKTSFNLSQVSADIYLERTIEVSRRLYTECKLIIALNSLEAVSKRTISRKA